MASLAALLERAAERFPDAGVVFDADRQTYAELLTEARGRLVLPRDAQHGAGRDADQAAHDGHDGAVAFDLQARDRERAVAARIDQAFDGPLQRRLGVVGPALAALARRARPVEKIHARQSTRRCGIIRAPTNGVTGEARAD